MCLVFTTPFPLLFIKAKSRATEASEGTVHVSVIGRGEEYACRNALLAPDAAPGNVGVRDKESAESKRSRGREAEQPPLAIRHQAGVIHSHRLELRGPKHTRRVCDIENGATYGDKKYVVIQYT